MLRIFGGALCIGLAVAIMCPVPVAAQEETGVPVIVPTVPGAEISPGEEAQPTAPDRPGAGETVLTGVIVEGNQRIEPETIESYMTIRPGDRFGPGDVNDSLKRLFETGLFADVTIRRQGSVLIVRVTENPIINRIAFEGNLRINDDTLSQEIQLRPRVVFTRTRVQSDVRRILDVYRRNGRFGATVEPKVVQLEQNRVDLIFEIDEGPLTGIDRISIIGNKRYSDRALKGEIFTRESRWYRFFSSADKYDPDQLAFDEEMLRRFYLKNGYADFRVVSSVAELTPDKDAFYITITIEEGERYRFGEIDVTSAISAVDTGPLMDEVTVETGDWYNADEVQDSILALTDAIGNLGYAFVDIRPNIERDREARTIDLTFEIQEAPRVFVERIDIGGNVRTLDEVIRREFRLVEGDAFNAAKLNRSRERIRNLGFFSRVEIETEQGSQPDKTVIKVDVAEQSTGELGLGAGYSTTDGALFNIVLRERNLLGKGQDIRATITVSQRTQEFDIGFTEPYFLERNLRAGFDLFHITQDNTTQSSFTSTRTGGGLRLGYEINEQWSQTLRYVLRQDVVEDIDADASLAIQEQEGTNITSLVGQDLLYDLRNSRIDPTSGFFWRIGTDYAGLGGDLEYVRGRMTTGFYVPFTDDVIGSVIVSGGIIYGFGEGVRITDRFFLGGDNLRGFATSGVGPRDISTGDALGGKKMYNGTVAVRFPIGLPEEFGVTGSLFSDFGTLTDIDQTTGLNIRDEPSIRISWGTGLNWRSPIGPLSLDFAWPLKKEDFDETEVFRLRFGTRF